MTGDIVDNHIIEKYKSLVTVKNAKPLPVECIVRGYLSGSGWIEYKEKQTVCGIPLPSGLKESSKLPGVCLILLNQMVKVFRRLSAFLCTLSSQNQKGNLLQYIQLEEVSRFSLSQGSCIFLLYDYLQCHQSYQTIYKTFHLISPLYRVLFGLEYDRMHSIIF